MATYSDLDEQELSNLGIVLTRRALQLRVAGAARFVALAASAQACGRQGRGFRDLAFV